MDNTSKWFDLILGEDERFTLEDRILNAILFSASVLAILFFITDIIQRLGPNYYRVSLAASIILISIYFYGRKKSRSKQILIPFTLFLIFIFFYIWHNNGGIEGTSLFFLMPVMFLFPLFVKGYYRVLFFCLIVFIGLIALWFEINNPEFVLYLEDPVLRKTNLYLSGVLVATTVLFILVLIIHSYKKEHKKVIDLNISKDKLFSIIAHDLRNPIGTLAELSNLLLEEHNEISARDREEIIETIAKSSRETNNLLENLLDWAHSESGLLKIKPKNLKVIQLIESNMKLFNESIRQKSLMVQKDIPIDLEIYVDFNMINTVFRNLLSNALKFSHKGGKIIISAERDFDNKQIRISFKDNGIGIEQEHLETIFDLDSNYRSVGTSQEKGTGIGLKLCKEFVERNNGEINVQSEVGKGSEFIILLPEG